MTKEHLRNHYFLYSNENECLEIMKYLESLDEYVYEMDMDMDSRNEWIGWRYTEGEWTQTRVDIERARRIRPDTFQIKWSKFSRKRKLEKLKEI